MKYILSIILFSWSLSAFGQAWDYIGIPYPTDDVPDEVMPTLPDGPATSNGFPYDPCDTLPTFADGVNQYYIDTVNGNDGTAGNSGRGSEANPRQTRPGVSGNTWTIQAGWQIFITENSTVGSNSDWDVIFLSTEENPSYIIGLGERPLFQTDRIEISGDYWFWANCRFYDPNGPRIKIGSIGVCNYWVWRGNLQYAEETSGTTNVLTVSGYEGAPTTFGVIWDCEAHTLNDWDQLVDTGDFHWCNVTGLTQHIWFVENHCHEVNGDMIQVGVSNRNTDVYVDRPHYTYIAGCTAYNLGENAVDLKNHYHTVISQNIFYNFFGYSSAPNYPDAKAILINNGEGPLASLAWILFNRVWNCTNSGIQISNTQAETVDGSNLQDQGSRVFAIGNLVYGAANGIALEAGGTNQSGPITRTWGEEMGIYDNTLIVNNRGIRIQTYNTQAAEPNYYTFDGNVIYNLGTGSDMDYSPGGGSVNVATDNVIYQTDGTINVSSGDFDTYTGNIENSDPLFNDVGTGDYSLSVSSPATDITGRTAAPAPYTLFQTLYGLNIWVDRNELTRPVNTLADAGAYEYGSGTDPEPDVGSAPDAPSSPTANATGYSTITIGWDDNSDNETGFRIERSLNDTDWSLAGNASVDATFFNDTGLSGSTLYYYRIRAYNAFGNSDYTSSASDTTDEEPEAPETGTPSRTTLPGGKANLIRLN